MNKAYSSWFIDTNYYTFICTVFSTQKDKSRCHWKRKGCAGDM